MSQEVVPQAPQHPEAFDVSLRDRGNPRSLINLVSPRVADAMEMIPEWYLDRTEQELRRTLYKRDEYTPELTENRLRVAFWREYEGAQKSNTQMYMARIYGGICTMDTFYRILRDKQRLAWILCPPADYMRSMQEALVFGIDELRDVLEASHRLPSGGVDTKLAQVKTEIVKMLDQRVQGAVVQKSQNLHVHAGQNGGKAITTQVEEIRELSPLELQAKIKELQARSQALSTPGARDVEVVDAELVNPA